MRSLIRVAAMATTLVVVLTSSLEAQSRGTSALSRVAPVVQGGSGAPMKFTLFGGIATGEGGLDMGLAISGSFEWDMAQWPVNLRVDPYFANHSGECGPFADCSFRLLGAGVGVSYDFPTANGRRAPLPLQGATAGPAWFVFGGLGIYNGSYSIDSDMPGFDDAYSDSETELGIHLGGGVKFGGRYRVEARFMSISDFTTIPILFGFTF